MSEVKEGRGRVGRQVEDGERRGHNDVTSAGRDKHVKRRGLIPSSTKPGPPFLLTPTNDEADPFPFEARRWEVTG